MLPLSPDLPLGCRAADCAHQHCIMAAAAHFVQPPDTTQAPCLNPPLWIIKSNRVAYISSLNCSCPLKRRCSLRELTGGRWRRWALTHCWCWHCPPGTASYTARMPGGWGMRGCGPCSALHCTGNKFQAGSYFRPAWCRESSIRCQPRAAAGGRRGRPLCCAHAGPPTGALPPPRAPSCLLPGSPVVPSALNVGGGVLALASALLGLAWLNWLGLFYHDS